MLVIWNMLSDNSRWFPNRAARALPPNDFHQIWVVGLHAVREDHWLHSVALLGPGVDGPGMQNVPTFIVDIGPDFSSWSVQQIQFAINVTMTFDVDPPNAPLTLEFLL
jgi:hypothetical protein